MGSTFLLFKCGLPYIFPGWPWGGQYGDITISLTKGYIFLKNSSFHRSRQLLPYKITYHLLIEINKNLDQWL
jgi:hypothetical protein